MPGTEGGIATRSAQRIRPVICIAMNKVAIAPMVTVRPVYLSSEEKRVREQDQIYELRPARDQCGETQARHQPQVADHKEHRYGRADHNRVVTFNWLASSGTGTVTTVAISSSTLLPSTTVFFLCTSFRQKFAAGGEATWPEPQLEATIFRRPESCDWVRV